MGDSWISTRGLGRRPASVALLATRPVGAEAGDGEAARISPCPDR